MASGRVDASSKVTTVPPVPAGGHSDADVIGWTVPLVSVAVRHAENSDVLPSAAVAVAVIASLTEARAVTSNCPAPLGFVVTESVPSQRAPSPLPLASHAALA